MKRIIYLSALCLAVFTSCKKSDTISAITEEPSIVKVPHGTVIGTPVVKIIGAAGGTIESADGHMKVMIPAGAVDENISFSIQEVTNSLQSGAPSYRLLPELVTFDQPVTIKYNYSGIESFEKHPHTFFLAYQATDGVYHQPKNMQADTLLKILTAQTKHFSDWTAYKSFDLVTPENTPVQGVHTLREDHLLKLKLRALIISGDPNNPTESDPELTLKHDALISSAQWSYTPQTGTLNVEQLAGTAIYRAPHVINTQGEQIAVSVKVTGNMGLDNADHPIQQLILLQHIVLVTDSYFQVTLDGTTRYLNASEYFLDLSSGVGITIGASFGNEYIQIISTLMGAGNQTYGVMGTGGKTYVEYGSSQIGFKSFRPISCDGSSGLSHASGSFNLSKYATNANEYSEGTMTANLFRSDVCISGVTKTVKVVFRIKGS